MRYNRGEWSELYAFIKLLKEGRVYAADQNTNRIDNQYLPIIKVIREEQAGQIIDYYTGNSIKLYKNGKYIADIPSNRFDGNIELLFNAIFRAAGGDGSFEIPGIQGFMEDLFVTKVKANSAEKVDIKMKIKDIHTGFTPDVGFSIKSDVGSPPTLLNPGKNTRFRYKINGLTDAQMNEINSINKDTEREYMKARFNKILSYTHDIEYDSMLDQTYEDNLVLIDSMLPRIYGEIILQHYIHIDESIYDCVELIKRVAVNNPLEYRRTDIYSIKFKKLITAAALGMTPGRVWDGRELATGGYIIIKRDGDVLCYHLYNRNFFEDYLLNNTRIDRPSASRHDYGYIFNIEGQKYIDLNVQVRFKTIGQ